ncbi:FAD-binding oxidoreductase [Anoxybacterium hadale]|uniref:FAD-binding oxidoreductase n=1 Tax=Anoxybacterium hadale TaxID=3408580 RepID=A0ACD1A696_9FIRM|nr:FAD-binding oxidoreductase [Clostridiales bacterium]
MKKTADVVVIGGGAAGTSTAYYLAKAGIKNVVLVEQQYTPFGGTGRCAAQFRLQFGSISNCKMGLLSVREFDKLGEESGYGDLEIDKHSYLLPAYTETELANLHTNVRLQNSLGIPTKVLDQAGCKEVAPFLEVDEILGGSYIYPENGIGDGTINPMKMALAFKKGAQDLGVEFNNYTKVTGIKVESGKVKGVITDQGEIATSCVVNAAGEYGKFIGRMAGVTIPVEPEKHQIAITEPLDYIGGPMIYSFKYHTYISQVKHGGFLFGWSDPNVKAGIIDFDPEWRVLEEIAQLVVKQVPALKNVRIVRHWAGQYGTGPDHSVIVGPVPEVEGFICALGLTKATMFAPAIGILAAEAAIGAQPTLPMAPYQIDRFARGELIIDPALL